jgi:GNAT superfamily N-acetyltransferase
MPSGQATSRDLPEIAALVNSAYRGDSARLGRTHEADLVSGQRTDPEAMARDLAGANPAVILALREQAGGPILASVFLERIIGVRGMISCYVGMLAVMPARQDQGFGRLLLARAEDQARDWGAQRMVMSVIDIRDTLIAYYERRGYRVTGEALPFHSDDPTASVLLCRGLTFAVMEKLL